MGVIWTPQKRTRQPTPIAQVRRDIAGSVVSAWLPVGAAGWNVASGAPNPNTATTGLSFGVNQNGTVMKYAGGSSTFAGISTTLPSTKRFTLVLAGGPTGGGGRFLANADLEVLVGGSTSFDIYISGALRFSASWPAAYKRGLVFSVDFTSSSNVPVIYVDGVKATMTPSGTPGTPTLSGTLMLFNHHAGLDRQGIGEASGAVVLKDIFSDQILKEWSQNPWQLFTPERLPIPFYVTTGGGSTVTGAGSSDGIGSASGVGASTSAQVGSSAGVGAASGVGASTADSVGSSSGTGTASGVGSSTGGSDGVGSSTGTGTASGIGASTAASLGSTAGVGTAGGIGASTAASVGSSSGTGEALGVGANGSVVSTGVGSASGTGTATGVSPSVSQGGGKTTGSNLSRKQKKKLKAVESQEWLKAEETARQLLSDRFTKQTPQEKAQALETYIESLQPVIEALKALTSQIEEVVEEAPVIELTPHQEVIQRFDRLEKKVKSVEELIIILMADL